MILILNAKVKQVFNENLSIYLFLSKNLILNLGNIIFQTFYIKNIQ